MAITFQFAVVCCLIAVCVVTLVGAQDPDDDWSYDPSHPHGPDHWHELPGCANCSGKNQAPINIVTRDTIRRDTSIQFINYSRYRIPSLTLLNDGRTVMVDFPNSSVANNNDVPSIRGDHLLGTYRLVNIHFHWGVNSSVGSEHTIDGRRYPMEMHFVHYNNRFESLEEASDHEDGLIVLGRFFNVAQNDYEPLKAITDHFDEVRYRFDEVQIPPFDLLELFGDYDGTFFYYDSSLTRPPCTEIVRWTIFQDPLPITENQLNLFRRLQSVPRSDDPNDDQPIENNYRPPQPVNGRKVYRSEGHTD